MSSPKKRFHSLASQLSLFVVGLVSWVIVVLVGYPLFQGYPVAPAVLPTAVVVLVVAVLVTLITSRLLVEPLAALQRAIQGVCEGRLDRIHVPGPFRETQILGDSFNHMVDALAASRREVMEYQNSLEERIRQRTVALERALHKAQAASRAKSEFLANMSHELRTPMNGVLGMLQILEDSPLSEEQREQLKVAQSCGQTLLALLNDILDLSKIEADRLTLEAEPVALHELIYSCADTVRPQAEAKGVAVVVAIHADTPREVIGDALRLRQILLNLLSNAVKFTEQGYVRVTGGCRRVGAETVELQLEVADTGIGIPPDKIDLIFDKFTQADGSVSRRHGGTGLGLAITKRLVELHGGKIWVESQPRLGSRFHVTLLLKDKQQAAPPAGAPLPLPRTQPPQECLPILLAEDNEVNQRVIQAILHRRGYRVEVASHGRHALELLEKGQFSLVIMDVQMPLMDGLEASRQIRSDPRWKHLPILALTAHAMEGDRERCLEAGMNDYLSKPVRATELLEKVTALLKQSAAAMQQAARPAQPPIDPEGLREVMGYDTDLMRDLLDLFLHLTPERIEQMRSAWEAGDRERLAREASRMATAAQSIAATRIAEAARSLERALQEGSTTTAEQHFRELEQECEALREHIKALEPQQS